MLISGTKLLPVAPNAELGDYTVPSDITEISDSDYSWKVTYTKDGKDQTVDAKYDSEKQEYYTVDLPVALLSVLLFLLLECH